MSFHIFATRTVRGFALGECVSALQKAIRRCDEQQALTWAVEIDQTGFGAMLWNRLLIIASEDIGLAETGLHADLRALYDNWKDAKARRNENMPERLFVVHAVMLLARAKKSRYVDNAIWATYAVEQPMCPEIPDWAIDGHTARGRAEARENGGRPNQDSYKVWNEATDVWTGDGPNPYYVRKESYRDAVGFAESKRWFKMQGKTDKAQATAAETVEDAPQQGVLV